MKVAWLLFYICPSQFGHGLSIQDSIFLQYTGKACVGIIKEMLQIAQRDGLEIVEIKRESHSAKETAQRPVFNEMIRQIKEGRFSGILAWHPDRLSRNAGDLGSIVDLMDQHKLIEVKTYGQRFSNTPSEKFLLMILCSQAKLDNDNKSVNVKRGLRTRIEMGLWPAPAPTGYLNHPDRTKKCHVVIDPARSHIIKLVFEKVAYEKWSGRDVYYWLRSGVSAEEKFKDHADGTRSKYIYYGCTRFYDKSCKNRYIRGQI